MFLIKNKIHLFTVALVSFSVTFALSISFAALVSLLALTPHVGGLCVGGVPISH